MNNLTILNHFEAIRTGRASATEIAEEIAAAVVADPDRYDQLLRWLDKAQHWSPLTNDQFIALRRKVKTCLEQPTVSTDAQTVPNLAPLAQGADNQEATLVAVPRHLDGGLTLALQRSGFFAWALIISGVFLVLGGWWWLQPIPKTASATSHTPIADNSIAPAQPIISSSSVKTTTSSLASAPTAITVESTPPPAKAFAVSAPASHWLAEIKRRGALGRLIPASDEGSAAYLLAHMADRYPDSVYTSQANQWFRQACLTAAEQARGDRQWQQAQLLLDSAFRELQARVED